MRLEWIACALLLVSAGLPVGLLAQNTAPIAENLDMGTTPNC
jgi:hypothetical protein